MTGNGKVQSALDQMLSALDLPDEMRRDLASLSILDCHALTDGLRGNRNYTAGSNQTLVGGLVEYAEDNPEVQPSLMQYVDWRLQKLTDYRAVAYNAAAQQDDAGSDQQFRDYFQLLGGGKDIDAEKAHGIVLSRIRASRRRKRRRRVLVLILFLAILAAIPLGALYLAWKVQQDVLRCHEEERWEDAVQAAEAVESDVLNYASGTLVEWFFVPRIREITDNAKKQIQCETQAEEARGLLLAGEEEEAIKLALQTSAACGPEVLAQKGLGTVGPLVVHALPAATVELFRNGNRRPIREAPTDSDGRVVFPFLDEGAHRLIARKDQYEMAEKEVVLDSPSVVEVELAMRLARGSIKFIGPKDAEVWLNGNLFARGGETRPSVEPTEYEFLVRQPDHHSRRIHAGLQPGAKEEVILPELTAFTATVNVHAVIVDVDVPQHVRSISGNGSVDVGDKTVSVTGFPTSLEVGLGSHTLTAAIPGYTPRGEPKSVYLEAGDTKTVKLGFSPEDALVQFSDIPRGAILTGPGDITVNPRKAMRVRPFRKSIVRISAPGYKASAIQVPALQPGETITQAVQLELLPPLAISGKKYFYRGQLYVQLDIEEEEGRALEVMPVDIVFLIDTSTSMRGWREQVNKGIEDVLSHLNSPSRFELIKFSTRPNPCFKGLKEPTETNLEHAHSWLKRYEKSGKTDLFTALSTVAEICNRMVSNNPMLLIVITDGKANRGIKDQVEIIQKVALRNHKGLTIQGLIKANAEINVFDLLSYRTGGRTEFIANTKQLREALRTMAKDILLPVLSEVRIESAENGSGPTISPSILPSLQRDGVLSCFVRAPQDTAVIEGTVRGFSEGKLITQPFVKRVAELPKGNAEVAKRWAAQRLQELYWDIVEVDQKAGAGSARSYKKDLESMRQEVGLLVSRYSIPKEKIKDKYPFESAKSPARR